jgi:hypothetical protein
LPPWEPEISSMVLFPFGALTTLFMICLER